MNRSQDLGHLQALDTEIGTKAALIRQLQAKLVDSGPSGQAVAILRLAEQAAAGLRARLANQELAHAGFETRLQGLKDRLYGGRVSSPKELAGLERDEQMLDRQRSKLEDQILQLMADLDAADARVQEASAVCEQARSHQEQDRATLALELINAQTELGRLQTQREALAAQVPAADLEIYAALLVTRGGRAVARVKNSACSVCGVEMASGLRGRVNTGQGLTFCASCGRILAL